MEGKVCIVTGGAMGLGLADAVTLSREGARVVITDVNTEAGRRAVEEMGRGVKFVAHDVTREDQWENLVDQVMSEFGRIDVLVNNAGIIAETEIESTDLDTWRKVNAVSVEGTFLGCKHVIKAMRTLTDDPDFRGSIINMSSVCAIVGFPTIVAYAAAKSAILGLTRTVAAHCHVNALPIRCNAILPGNMDTPMVRSFVGDAVASVSSMGTAADIGEAVLYLADDRSRYLNGAEIVIDNGIRTVGRI